VIFVFQSPAEITGRMDADIATTGNALSIHRVQMAVDSVGHERLLKANARIVDEP
jgi:hypothetical protein